MAINEKQYGTDEIGSNHHPRPMLCECRIDSVSMFIPSNYWHVSNVYQLNIRLLIKKKSWYMYMIKLIFDSEMSDAIPMTIYKLGLYMQPINCWCFKLCWNGNTPGNKNRSICCWRYHGSVPWISRHGINFVRQIGPCRQSEELSTLSVEKLTKMSIQF